MGILELKLDNPAQMANLETLMTSICFATFCVEKMTWRATILSKKIHKKLARKLVKEQHKIGGAPGVTHG